MMKTKAGINETIQRRISDEENWIRYREREYINLCGIEDKIYE